MNAMDKGKYIKEINGGKTGSIKVFTHTKFDCHKLALSLLVDSSI